MSKEGKKVDRGMSSLGKIFEDNEILPGFRFHPTDEELVAFYLRRKVENRPVATELIKQIDIYKYDPWDLPKMSNMEEKEWYFFCLRGRKYKNSIRPNRVTGSGFWKATGIDRPISSLGEDTNQCIGLKKSLVYYRGSAGKGTKTDWMMHEFRLPSCTKAIKPPIISTQEAEIWTICRIFKRIVSYKKYTQELKKASPTKGPSTQPSSTTWTTEAEHLSIENSDSFGPYICQQNELDQSEERNGTVCDPLGSIAHQAPFAVSYSSFLGSNFGALEHQIRNFDELRAVVDGAISPNPYAFADSIRRY